MERIEDDVLWLERMMRRNKENAERRKQSQEQRSRLVEQKARQYREWLKIMDNFPLFDESAPSAALPEPELPPPNITVSTDGTSPKGFEGEMWVDSVTGEMKVLLNGEWVEVIGTVDKQKEPDPKKQEQEEKPKPRRKLDLSL